MLEAIWPIGVFLQTRIMTSLCDKAMRQEAQDRRRVTAGF